LGAIDVRAGLDLGESRLCFAGLDQSCEILRGLLLRLRADALHPGQSSQSGGTQNDELSAALKRRAD
jgi:hypothetical protein